jgi:Protein of unknown function (DUF2505)
MRIARSIDYAATPHEVFAVVADHAFQEAKLAATGSLAYSATVTESGQRVLVSTIRELPTDGFPDFAKSFVGEVLTILEKQDWGPAGADGSRVAVLDISIHGAPLTLKGTVGLAPGGAGTEQSVDSVLKAGIPLIGGRIEKFAAGPIQQAIDIEFATLRQFLGG